MMKRMRWLLMVASVGCAATPTSDPPTHHTGAPVVERPGAGDQPVVESDDPKPDGPILLAVRGMTMDAERRSRRALEIDDRLSTGDFFAYHVRVDRDAFVYVLQFYADGSAQVLFPERGSERVHAGKETRVPRDPRAWFQLDEATGTEHLYVIASTLPIETSAPELAALVGNVRTSPTSSVPGEGAASSGDSDSPRRDDAPPSHGAPPIPAAPAPRATPAPTRVSRPGPVARHLPRLRERAAVLVRVEDDGVVEYRGRAPDDGVGVVHFPFEHR